ncbi:MAG: DNA mismatch repair endonuclease MutL [Erysipelotrichaceae bacterium]|nr:DNA mismatch repair endonuclease MutL [Erysipelotrichaceae bacterium]
MGKIHTLDEHLTNMIAAGEVVERPSGVVKELVENSIDAEADRITVRVFNGGRDSIEVTDNGYGMDKQDAVYAFNRHATSKISTTEDLWDIQTMGFRGEALPSIASVAKVYLLTGNGEESTEVNIEYGKIVKAAPAARGKGTTIKVEGLFFKTPARLKHLKSGNAELNSILDVMQKFALAHPEIAFELYSEDKLKLQTPGNGSLEETMMHIYGLEIARNSLPVEFEDYDFKVKGILVLPSINRSVKSYMNVFINGRMIRNYLIQKAVTEAYREFMMPDRYPICVLNVEADFRLVDVNVHPSKWEIRLSKDRQLYNLVRDNINRILKEKFRPGEIHVNRSQTKVEEQSLFTETYRPEPVKQTVLMDEAVEAYKPDFREEYKPAEPVVLDRFQYLAQLHGNYIIACDDENLYIVDQHAAMERCMYEEIQNEIDNENTVMQPLLVPLVVELTPVQYEQLEKLNEVFETMGMKLEPFSKTNCVIREVPVWFEDINEKEFVDDLIEEILSEKKMNVQEIRKDKIATLACHSSIRFNRKLDALESRNLLQRLGRCAQPFNCPHGRPTMMAISEAQLIKEFKRG